MSVYQGFATRQQETHYFHLVERIVKLIAKKCLSSIYEHHINDEQWAKEIKRAFTHIHQEDEHKYVYPRFSDILKPFVYFVSQRYGLLRCPSNDTSKTRRNQRFAKFFESASTGSNNNNGCGDLVEDQKSYIENTMTLKAYFNQAATDASWGSSAIHGKQSPTNSNIRFHFNDDSSAVKFQDESIKEVDGKTISPYNTQPPKVKRTTLSKQLNKSAMMISRDHNVNKINHTLLKKASLNPYEQHQLSPMISRKLIKVVKHQEPPLSRFNQVSESQNIVKRGILNEEEEIPQRPQTQALGDAMRQIMNVSNKSLIVGDNQQRIFQKRKMGRKMNQTNRENMSGRVVRNITPVIGATRSASSSLSADRGRRPSKQSIQKMALVEEGSQLIYQHPPAKFVQDIRAYSNKTPL